MMTLNDLKAYLNTLVDSEGCVPDQREYNAIQDAINFVEFQRAMYGDDWTSQVHIYGPLGSDAFSVKG